MKNEMTNNDATLNMEQIESLKGDLESLKALTQMLATMQSGLGVRLIEHLEYPDDAENFEALKTTGEASFDNTTALIKAVQASIEQTMTRIDEATEQVESKPKTRAPYANHAQEMMEHDVKRSFGSQERVVVDPDTKDSEAE